MYVLNVFGSGICLRVRVILPDLRVPDFIATFGFNYKFQSLKMTIIQEYLVYDWKGMITSVGGSLGLFLGFSFLDFSFHLINAFEKWMQLTTKSSNLKK